MKNYIFLRRSRFNSYHHISDYVPSSNLRFLRGYFEIDYKYHYEEYVFNNIVSSFNEYFIYNDQQNKMLYIGRADWELDEEEMCPSDEEFPNYVNDTNSCKLSVDNYLEFRTKWVELKKVLPAFAIIYRDDNDWVDCKGFDTKEEMELFVKNYQPQVMH